MVLTRAQRAQTAAGGVPAVDNASTTKARAGNSASSTREKETKTKASKTPVKAEEDEKAAKTIKPTARAALTTTTTISKSMATKGKEIAETLPAARSSRTRKQVKFADAEKPVVADSKPENITASKIEVPTRGRPKKAAASATSTSKSVKTAVKKSAVMKVTVVDKLPAGHNESEPKSTSKTDILVVKCAQPAGLGKPIRAKKAQPPTLKSSSKIKKDASPVQSVSTGSSSLSGPEPKLAPPIRASPTKLKSSPVRMNIAQPSFALSAQKPSASVGSPIRMGNAVNSNVIASPIRATPQRMLQSSQPGSVTFLKLAQPVFTNPLLHSPMRSAKKPAHSTSQLQNPATPSRSIGTPIRRPAHAPGKSLNIPQTVQPKKRSYIESPRRPATAQAAKRFKTVGTPQRLFGTGLTDWQARAEIAAETSSVKKTVAFEEPDVENVKSQTPSKVAISPSHRFHRMSAVTEVTEPEETLPELVGQEVLEEMLQDTDTAAVTIRSMTDQEADEDICMAEVVSAEFLQSSPVKNSASIERALSEAQTTAEVQVSLNDIIDKQYVSSSPKKPSNNEMPLFATIDMETKVENEDTTTDDAVDVHINGDMEQKIEIVESAAEEGSLKQVVLNSSLLATDVLDLAIATPLPEPLTILGGMAFYVDVWAADGTNANHFFIPLLEELGAVVFEQWSSDVTHVLFKDGLNETLKNVATSHGKVLCLNVGWAVDCERYMERMPEQGYEIDPSLEGTFTPAHRTPLQEIQSNRKITPALSQKESKTPAKTPSRTPSKALSKTPRKTPARTPGKTQGKTPGTVKFNATVMAFHEAIQTPELSKDNTVDVDTVQSPLAHATPLMQKTCPPKQTGQQYLAADVTKSAVKRRLFQGRNSLGVALNR